MVSTKFEPGIKIFVTDGYRIYAAGITTRYASEGRIYFKVTKPIAPTWSVMLHKTHYLRPDNVIPRIYVKKQKYRITQPQHNWTR